MTPLQQKIFADIQNKTIFENTLDNGLAYIKNIFDRNVFPTAEALKNLDEFDEAMPEKKTDANLVIDKLNQYGSAATVANGGGRYFGFVTGGALPVGLAAKILGTLWDQNAAMYVQSPIVTKLESVVESWLKSIFNLPSHCVAGFVSGSFLANLSGLAAGRYRLLQNKNWDINKKGLAGSPHIKIVLGKEAHSTVFKALGILGLGQDNLTLIDCDDQGRIKPELLPQLDDNTLLILSAGNVNTGSFDNFSVICKKAKEAGAWVHIDGAFGLWASAVPQLAHLTNGMEYANSWAVDGHKTLNTPYDSGIILCNDKEALSNALHIGGAYLTPGNNRDGMFYTTELSRRSRVIELWATLKYLGKEGVQEMVYEFHQRAKQFEKELSKINGLYILNEVVFNQVLIGCDNDNITQNVLQEIQNERICWCGNSLWNKKKVIRISVSSWATTQEDVTLSVASFYRAIRKHHI